MKKIFAQLLVLAIAATYIAWAARSFSAEIYARKAEAQRKKGDLPKALEYYRSATRLAPDDYEYLRALGLAYWGLNDNRGNLRSLGRSLQALQKGREINAAYPYAWYEVAVIMAEMEKVGAESESPEPYFKKALEIDSKNPLFLAGFTSYLLEKGKKDEAKIYFMRLVNVDPLQIDNYGAIFIRSESDAELLISLLKQNPTKFMNFASFLQKNGYGKLVGEFLDGLSVRQLEDLGLALAVSRIYSQRGDNQKAREVLEISIESNPDSVRLLERLGDMNRKEGELEKALDYYRKLQELRPWSLPNNMKVAHVASLLGNYDLALMNYAIVLKDARANRALVREYRGDIKVKIGYVEGAAEEYRKSLEENPNNKRVRAKLEKLD